MSEKVKSDDAPAAVNHPVSVRLPEALRAEISALKSEHDDMVTETMIIRMSVAAGLPVVRKHLCAINNGGGDPKTGE